jgi:hypothetical protein
MTLDERESTVLELAETVVGRLALDEVVPRTVVALDVANAVEVADATDVTVETVVLEIGGLLAGIYSMPNPTPEATMTATATASAICLLYSDKQGPLPSTPIELVLSPTPDHSSADAVLTLV